MKAEHDVVETLGLFRIHTHYYASPAPRGTVILVNGSLATTASFAQTVRYLQPHFNVVLFDEPYAGQSKPLNSNRRPITKEHPKLVLCLARRCIYRSLFCWYRWWRHVMSSQD